MIDELVSRLQHPGTMIEKVNRFRKNVSLSLFMNLNREVTTNL